VALQLAAAGFALLRLPNLLCMAVGIAPFAAGGRG
jgi:hypothetical protein